MDKTPGETYTAFSAWVGWPSIGPVAAGPARPAPTALYLLFAHVRYYPRVQAKVGGEHVILIHVVDSVTI